MSPAESRKHHDSGSCKAVRYREGPAQGEDKQIQQEGQQDPHILQQNRRNKNSATMLVRRVLSDRYRITQEHIPVPQSRNMTDVSDLYPSSKGMVLLCLLNLFVPVLNKSFPIKIKLIHIC